MPTKPPESFKDNGIAVVLLYAPSRIRAVPVVADCTYKYGAAVFVPFAIRTCCNPEFIRIVSWSVGFTTVNAGVMAPLRFTGPLRVVVPLRVVLPLRLVVP